MTEPTFTLYRRKQIAELRPYEPGDSIEKRLVAGPYLELFARQKREGWTVWGNETDKFGEARTNEPALFDSPLRPA